MLIKTRRKIFSVAWSSAYYFIIYVMDGGWDGRRGGRQGDKEGGREEEMIDGGSADGWKGEGMAEKAWERERGINEC